MDSKKIKILFVCYGNICRSPAAEGAFKKIVEEKNLTDFFEIDSAGISNYHIGEEPYYLTKQVALERNIKLNHYARQFKLKDFEEFDYIFAMDEYNYRDILKMARNDKERKKIKLFREFDPIADSKSVPDPYYGDITDFREVQQIVERTSQHILDYIIKKYKIHV